MRLPAFSDLSTGGKLGLAIAVFALGLVALTGLTIAHIQDALVEDRREKLEQLVETAKGVLSAFESQARAGEISTPEAQRRAVETLRTIRYGGDKYFWIADGQLRLVMKPFQPEREGQALAPDPKNRLFRDLVAEVARTHRAGFVEHAFPRPGSEGAVQKLSYAAPFEPWGWVIGTGGYVDDIAAAVRSKALHLVGVNGLVLLIVLGLAMAVARGILDSIRAMTASMEAISAGHTDVTIPGLTRRDEIGAMSRTLEVFKANVARIDQLHAERDAHSRATAERRQAEMHGLADDFERSVKSVVDQVAGSARDLQIVSDSVIRTALDATASAGELAGEAQDTAKAVTAVARRRRSCPSPSDRSPGARRSPPPPPRRRSSAAARRRPRSRRSRPRPKRSGPSSRSSIRSRAKPTSSP